MWQLSGTAVYAVVDAGHMGIAGAAAAVVTRTIVLIVVFLVLFFPTILRILQDHFVDLA